ncbi:hypothetical protein DPMN_148495 [Dreissena polymorpha]|uniref:Uncharacterized protein n=1 Tax=Dreissena polymorpha TaxID=45954 RepID=A0A9D4FCK9_DREPO|nr:hypothetical protein DPMN_148495 [Dreissena polymorpha]
MLLYLTKKEELGAKGNALLYRLAGSHLYLSPTCSYEAFSQRLRSLAGYIRSLRVLNCRA